MEVALSTVMDRLLSTTASMTSMVMEALTVCRGEEAVTVMVFVPTDV